jgi:hypothetical protein
MNGRKTALLVSIVLMAGIGTLFSNCSQSLPSDVAAVQQASSSSTGSQSVRADLQADIVPYQIPSSGSAQITPSGGRPPYSYTVVGGSPTISSTGLVSGPFVDGAALVFTVTDATGDTAQLTLSVSGGATSNALNCATPFNTSIASGTSIVAFKAASVACTSTCQSETRTCTNGTLSGSYTFKSCVRATCTVFGGGGGSGNGTGGLGGTGGGTL